VTHAGNTMSAEVTVDQVVQSLVATHIAPQSRPSDLDAFLQWARSKRISIVFVDLPSAARARETLAGCATQIGIPCAHPTGFLATSVKAAFVKAAIAAGVDEIDMGLNIDRLREGDFGWVTREVRQLMDVSEHAIRLVFTADLPLLLLADALQGCEAIVRGGGEAVCTAWGYGVKSDADLIKTLASRFSGELQVEASGGIRTYAVARDMLAYGAYRVHSGHPDAILKEALDD